MTNLKLSPVYVDPQTHFFEKKKPLSLAWQAIFNKGEPRNLRHIYEYFGKIGNDKNKLVSITGRGKNNPYDHLLKTLGSLPRECQAYLDFKDRFIGMNHGEAWTFLMRGQELSIDNKKLLLNCGDENIEIKDGEKDYMGTVIRALDMGALVFGGHPLEDEDIDNIILEKKLESYGGSKNFWGNNGESLYSSRDLDGLIVDLPTFKSLGQWEAALLSRRITKRNTLVYTSRAEILEDTFNLSTYFKSLDFSSYMNLKTSIRLSLLTKGHCNMVGKSMSYRE